MIRPDEVGGLNPEDLISGDNGHEQKLNTIRTQVVADPRKRRQMVERVCVDQFGNIYLVYSSKLSDREIYEVTDRVKDSTVAKYGGFTDALLDDFRSKAFYAFDEEEKALARERSQVAGVVDSLMRGVNLGGN